MKKQKICIIGGGLTGLVTAISLSKLNCKVDLIAKNINQNLKNEGTVAISENNLAYLNDLNISKSLKNISWPCTTMKLYSQDKNKKFLEIFELVNNKTKVLYMLQNSMLAKLLINKISKIKNISVLKANKISKIDSSGSLQSIQINKSNTKYNLVVICAGSSSDLVKNIFRNKKIENSYKEFSFSTILNHSLTKNNIARQFFLDDEILALLPISNKQTSVVWTIKKNSEIINLSFVRNKIKKYVSNYLKNITFKTGVNRKDLNFLIRHKFHTSRILLFGDALHSIHPFAGQGFNMTLRDLACLEKKIKDKVELGLDLGSTDVLKEYSNEIKSRNFAFSISLNILKNSFSIKNKYFKSFRNLLAKNINTNNYIKNIFFNIANKGFKF